jgi:hypothetical protein
MQVINWIASNWQAVCGWATVLVVLYRIGAALARAVTGINMALTRFTQAEQTITSVKGTVELLSTNHLPHILAELQKTNEHLSDMKDDFRLILLQKIKDNE